MSQINYSVIIPVYNAAPSLEELYHSLIHVFDNIINEPFEIIFIDDASGDQSWEILQKLATCDKRVRIFQLTRNFGQHSAILCGFAYCSGKYIITMDDDLQHPPEEMPKLIAKIKSSNLDVVLATYKQKQHSFLRNIGTRIINHLLSIILNKNKNLKLTSFRIIRREIIDVINNLELDKPKINPLLLYITNKIENVEVEHRPRVFGKSGYKLSKLVKTFFSYIINDSVLPIKILGYIGIINLIASFSLIVYYLYEYFHGMIRIPGWMTIIILILLFNGLILFSFSILGEYLLKILNQSKKMPNFIIRKFE